MRLWLLDIDRSLKEYKTHLQSPEYRLGPGRKEDPEHAAYRIACVDKAQTNIGTTLLPAFDRAELTTLKKLMVLHETVILMTESGYFSWQPGQGRIA